MKVLKLQPRHLKQLQSTDVEAIYLFGSRALNIHHELSDYDYGVLTQNPGHSKGDPLYETLYPLLSDISERTLDNDVLDIVFVRDCNLELRFHIVQYGQVLYDRNAKKRLEFENQTTLLYCDFKPLLDQFDQTILKSL